MGKMIREYFNCLGSKISENGLRNNRRCFSTKIFTAFILVFTFFISVSLAYDYKNTTSDSTTSYIQNSGDKSIQDMYKLSHYDKLVSDFHAKQLDFFNKWFAIIGLIVTIFSVVFPILFVVVYARQRSELDEIIDNIRKEENSIKQVKANLDSEVRVSIDKLDSYAKKLSINEKIMLIERYRLKGKFDTASDLVGEIFSIDPIHVQGFYYLGLIYLDQGYYPSCISVCKRGLYYHSQNLDLIAMLSGALIYNNELEEAIEILEDALKDFPKDAYVVENLSHAYNAMSKYSRTINLISTLPSTFTIKHPDVSYNLAKAYIMSDEFKEGLNFLELYCKLTKKPTFDDGDFESFSSKLKNLEDKEFMERLAKINHDMKNKNC